MVKVLEPSMQQWFSPCYIRQAKKNDSKMSKEETRRRGKETGKRKRKRKDQGFEVRKMGVKRNKSLRSIDIYVVHVGK